MKYYLCYIGIIINLASLFYSCDENPQQPPIHAQSTILTAEEVGVTEVWLRIRLSPFYQSVVIKRSDRSDTLIKLQAVSPQTLPSDTLILDNNSVLPHHQYTYSAFLGRKFKLYTIPETDSITVITMDTTSHDFQWHLDTLGDGASSILFDIAIINDTLAYAVGKIYKKDSTGQFENEPYNLAIWNGKQWSLLRLSYQGIAPPIRSIIAVSENNIWLDPWFHWNGQSFEVILVDPVFWGMRTLKMWGNSSELYAVGTAGFIAHFNGSTWQKLESGTTLDIQDIWGALNPKTNQEEIIAAAGNPDVSFDHKILSISDTVVKSMPDSGIFPHALTTIWFSPGRKYWLGGGGVWDKDISLDWGLWHELYPTPYYTNRIRGNDINDVFICGAYGDLLHFNGQSWRSYHDQTKISDGGFNSIAITGSLVLSVGEDNPRAVVAIGRRK